MCGVYVSARARAQARARVRGAGGHACMCVCVCVCVCVRARARARARVCVDKPCDISYRTFNKVSSDVDRYGHTWRTLPGHTMITVLSWSGYVILLWCQMSTGVRSQGKESIALSTTND